MLRIIGAALAIAIIGIVALTSLGPLPAAGDGAAPSFVPQLAPTPSSPTPVQTALPNPISRPDDAHGITQTTAPFASPTGFSPAPVPPALWLSGSSSFTVPCDLHGDRIFVSVVVDGKPETFLLDSSAPFSTIDPAAAPSKDVPINLSTLQIGELRFNRLRAGVTRVSAGSLMYLGKAADGVLGQELFSRYAVRIDYRPCSITVLRDAQAAAGASPPSNARTFPLRMVKGQPQMDVRFNGGASAALVADTGSDAEADVSSDFVESNKLVFVASVPELRRWLPSGQLSGVTGRAASLSLGMIVLDRPLVGVFAADNRTAATGYLGNGFLDDFSLLFDEPVGQLTLTPVPDARRFTYDRSGAWLILRGGAVTVKSVLPESPAGQIALQPGDRIVAVNGQAAADLDVVRALLAGPAGTTVVLTYERGGKQHSGSIELKTLL
ncbi:MAG TPA: PDZ domain-containing protein [Candidatus Eremiobacteraceae bacterium]|nr:PDZ domain-containing protein [Candidatus Eremiobacteraceae bacterium]